MQALLPHPPPLRFLADRHPPLLHRDDPAVHCALPPATAAAVLRYAGLCAPDPVLNTATPWQTPTDPVSKAGAEGSGRVFCPDLATRVFRGLQRVSECQLFQNVCPLPLCSPHFLARIPLALL